MDPITLAILGGGVAVVAVVLLSGRKLPAVAARRPQPGEEGEAFIRMGQRIGLKEAGRIVEVRLGELEAGEHMSRLGRAFGPPPAPPSAPN